jgi:nucleoside-diphosphate-sugar epimerase
VRVFVTGGSGFIGLRLVRQLIAGGHEVICLSRSGQTSARLSELGAEVLSGDLTDPDSVAGSLREAQPTHVAHLAAEIATQRNRERIEQVNVRGTTALVQACRELPDLECFLFLSSVVRGQADGAELAEDDVIRADTSYGKSKQQGDELVLGAHAEWGLPAVILRPSHVYGPGGWFQSCLEDRLFRLPGNGENLWDVVHVDDVVSACALLLEQAPAGKAFHVVDDEPVTMKDFFDRAARAAGRKPFKHAPVWLAKLIKGGNAVDAATRSARSSNSKLKGLGWTPRYPSSAEGVPAAVEAIRGHATRPTAAGPDTSSEAPDGGTPSPSSQ